MVDLIAFTSSLVFLAAFSAWVALELIGVRSRWVAIYGPVLLVVSALSFFTIDGVMGWPSRNLPAEFMLLDYRTNGRMIYIWGIEKGTSVPRTWVTEYTDAEHEQLEKAKQEAANGRSGVLKRSGSSGPANSSPGKSVSRYEFKLFDSSNLKK